jgi:CheY-like chemotaxis protein
MSSEESSALIRPLEGIFVLVVEDYDDARTLYTTLLAMNGAQVTAAASVAEARESFERTRFDVLVSDINMPGEDGLDLIKWVRSHSEGESGAIPAVAVSAFGESLGRDELLEAGFQEYLAKPVDGAELVETIARLVQNRER